MPSVHALALPRLCLLLLLAGPVAAQEARPLADDAGASAEEPGADIRFFRAINEIEAPAFAAWMHTADATFFPAVAGAVPAIWMGTYLAGGERDWQPAVNLTLAELTAVATTVVSKNLIRRPRPFATLRDVHRRTGSPRLDTYSFPSGHALIAFAMASSVSLSYPEWYVVAPAALWASSVALSRPWLGVHYPSDIVVGALVGTGVGVAVHLIAPAITPDFLRRGSVTPAPPVFFLAIPIR